MGLPRKGLKGLGAKDRTPEDQRDIQEINTMATDSINSPSDTLNMDLSNIHPFQSEVPVDKSFDNEAAQLSMDQYFSQLAESIKDKKAKDEQYYANINSIREQTRSGLNINNKYTQEIKDIAAKVSPYYQKFRMSDMLTLTDAEWNELAAQYAGMYEAYGEEVANQQLNQSIKDNVASNQSIIEKGWYALAGMGADAAGSTISTAGLLYGLGKAITGNYEKNPYLNGAENFLNAVLDNEVTRYGSDVVKYGTILKLDEARELGISATEIMNTSEQDNQLLSWNTPFEVIQQGGFTIASMLTGAAASKVSNLAFRGIKKGALATAENLSKAKQTISTIQKVENFNNRVIVPGIVGTTEGVIEGLETKMGIEESGYNEAYAAQRKAVEEEVMKRLGNYTEFKKSPEDMPKYYDKDGNEIDVSALYNQVWDEMKPKLDASLAHVDAMATKAGNANFLVNSAINGMINATYKAGLQSESVQKSLRKGKLTGWAFANEGYEVKGTLGNAKVKPKVTKLGKAWMYTKEPLGEFKEEYLQTMSNTLFTGYADASIHSFIDGKYNGGVQRAIGESTSEDWAAAWTEFEEGLTSKEAIKAGVYGALSSVAGTPVLGKRTNKLDKNGNVVVKRDRQGNIKLDKNGRPIAEKTYFGRGQSADGDLETGWEAFQRWMPWRSGLTANIKEVNARLDASKEQAKALEDWLNNPDNKSKFDGLVGSLSWMKSMQDNAAIGDEYNYRNSKLGKAISDIFMLQKTEGSELYNSIMKQLVEVAYMEKDSKTAQQYVQSVKDNVNNDNSNRTDDEIFNELKSNAQSMLDMMAKVKEESNRLEKLLGDVDEDTKQSLIYGQLSIEDWEKRGKQLDEELKGISIENSTGHSTNLTEKQKSLIANYGSIENAKKEQERLGKLLESIKTDIKTISKRGKAATTQESLQLKLLKVRKADIEEELSNLKELAKISEDATTVLNEEEIMALNPIERKNLILRAKQKLYGKLHQSTSEQAKGETTEDNSSEISEEQKKVIDNLVSKGMAADKDFLSKIVDAGRIAAARDRFLKQYNQVLMSPEGLQTYAARVKQQAADELTKERAKKIAEIQDYTEFASALNNAFTTSSNHDSRVIEGVLKDNPNFVKYKEQEDTIERIVNTLNKSDKFKDLDGNSADLLIQATAFLYDSGVDLKDENAVWNALTAVDENGYNNFVSFVERQNEGVDPSQKTTFTSLEEVYQTYKDVLGQVKLDIATQERLKEPVKTTPTTSQPDPTPPPTPTPASKESSSKDTPEKLDFITTDGGVTLNIGDKIDVDTNNHPNADADGHVKGTITGFRKQPDGSYDVVFTSDSGKPWAWSASVFDTERGKKITSDSRPGVFGKAAKSVEESNESLKKEKEDETPPPANPLEQAKKDEGKPLPKKEVNPTPQRAGNVNAAQIEAINIDQLRAENPNSPIVAFYDRHHVQQFLSSGKINGDTDVYFVTNSQLTKEVQDETSDYNPETDLPIIAVVEDENGQIEINGKKYQPIGIIPSSREQTTGSARMSEVRKNATDEGLVMFQGKPIRTKPVAGGVKASPADNNVRTNTSLDELMSKEMTPSEQEESNGLNKSDRRKLQSYQRVKKFFMSRMGVGSDPKTEKKGIFFRQSRMKDSKAKEENHINIFIKSIDNTTGKDSNKTLLDLYKEGANVPNGFRRLTHFNSRTEGILRVIEKFLNEIPNTANFESGTIEEVERRVDKLQKDLSRYLYLVGDGREWHYELNRVPGDAGVINGERAFNLTLVNNEGEQISLTTFVKTDNAEDIAGAIIANLAVDNSDWRRNAEGYPIIKWQVDYGDVDKMQQGNKQATLNISELVDDGVFELPATSLTYENVTAVINAPFMDNSQPRYPIEANPDNATQATSTGSSQVNVPGGKVDTDSGTVVEGTPTPTTIMSEERAKQIADQIVEDSKLFKLSDDERSYVNTKTGRIHNRVTSVISADVAGSKFEDSGWGLPSTNIGTTIDEIVRDFFSGEFYMIGTSEYKGKTIYHANSRRSRTEKDEWKLDAIYPNATTEDIAKFVCQLQEFKAILDSKGIKIIPRDVVCSGVVNVTADDGKTYSLDVAGTLDLLGYDSEGNFYVFDMKTVRDPSSISQKKHKWSLQTSLYQKFLENKYGIKVKERFIIPIHVKYDNPSKVKYEQGEGTQLIADGKEFRGASPTLLNKGLVAIPYTEPKIEYNKLSEEERASMASNVFNIDALDRSKVDIDITINKNEHEGNKTLKIYLKDQHEKGWFELVKDREGNRYSVHFKTGNADTGEIYGSTKEERNILFEELRKAIPDNAIVSTWGNVSDKGAQALDKLGMGMTKIGEREVKDRQGNTRFVSVYEKTTPDSVDDGEVANGITELAKNGGTTTGEVMEGNPVKTEVAESPAPAIDTTLGIPLGDLNDITGGLFDDNIDDNILAENDGSINTPVPGKTPWKDMTEAQQEVLKKAGYTEESWNATEEKEVIDHAKDCLDV